MPSTVNKIYLNAFRNCSSLGRVDCYAEKVPTMDDSAFEGVYGNTILRVPYSKESTYKLTFPWNQFGVVTHLPIITYVIDGAVYAQEQVPYGSAIVPPVVEKREGYLFAWGDYPKTMPDEDVIINGSYIATAINDIKAEAEPTDIYSVNGYRTSKLQRGLNIIRQQDGKVKKVLVR